MIDLTMHEDRLERAAGRAKERGVVVPTFAQMKDPASIPEGIRERLGQIGLWDVHPLNLFRISWKNEPIETGSGLGE